MGPRAIKDELIDLCLQIRRLAERAELDLLELSVDDTLAEHADELEVTPAAEGGEAVPDKTE